MKKKSKKKNLFKKGLTFYLVFLGVIFLGILVMLWSSLAKYQKGLDQGQAALDYERDLKRAPQLAFTQYVEGLTEDDWLKLWYESHPLMLDSESDVRAYINEHVLAPGYDCYKASTYTEEAPVYLVSGTDGFMATFSLVGSGLEWQVNLDSINVNADAADMVEAVNGINVLCNGVALDESMGQQAYLLAPEAYEQDLVNPIGVRTYDIGGLLSVPSFSGNASIEGCGVETDSNGVMMLTIEDDSSYKTKAEGFVKSLLNYYKMGKNSVSENMAAAISHVASGSDAASVIRSSLDGVLWANYTNANYTTWTSSVYKIADNSLAVDVYYYDENELVDGVAVEDITQVYRVYFIDMGSGYKIYSFSLR